MAYETLIEDMWVTLDATLYSCVTSRTVDLPSAYSDMILYQLGWDGTRFDNSLTGKRVRPLLLLLTVNALGGEWRKAVPAAAALELIHNFSLVHDDIQDSSTTRRGRDTAWVKWGEAQAINTGDAILSLANLELMDLQAHYLPQSVLAALSVANQAIFNLTRGQFLDIAHEKAEDVNLNDYWRMVEGKTGALFSASFAIGALLAGKSDELIIRFIELGQKIGMAFQVQDDYLGIWGKDDETGKSVESDLYSRKKTYPVQFALENLADVRDYWIRHDRFDEKDVTWIREKLQEHGVNGATLTVARMFYEDCLTDLSVLINNDEDAAELRNLITSLFTRMK